MNPVSAQCPKCGTLYCVSRVFDSPPAGNGQGGYELSRRFYCDHCKHIVSWLQSCTHEGRVFGAPLTRPFFITSQTEINRFFKRYPEALSLCG